MDKIYFETLLELKKYNEKLLVALESIVDSLRGQRDDQALELFRFVVEGLSWVLEVIGYTKCILKEYGFSGDVENINQILKEITEALQNQDYVLLGDLIEYEMLPFLNDIQSTLDKMDIHEMLNNK